MRPTGYAVRGGGTLARTGLPSAVAGNQHNANNQLSKANGTAYSHDNNGNLTSDGARTYTWNARNQLTAITGADTANYAYDGLGRRRSATVNGLITSTLYDGWNPIQVLSGTSVLENRLYCLDLDSVFARTRGGVTESFLTDALGSVTELRNAAQDQTVQYTYDPYGSTTASVASTNNIKYTGRELDTTDLYYYRHRYVKPSIQRFISEDPIGLAGGSNLYGYVENDPVNWVDPLGLAACFSCHADDIQQGLQDCENTVQDILDSLIDMMASEHTKNKRPSSQEKHEKGQSRQDKDKGGEKGDKRRPYQR